MSDTPKYAYWYLSEAEQERLQAQQREEERLREQQMLEEAERHRKARLLAFKSRLNEQIQDQKLAIRARITASAQTQTADAAAFAALEAELDLLSSQLLEAEWEEDAQKIHLSLRKLISELGRIADFLNQKEKLLSRLQDALQNLQLRKGLRSVSEPLLSAAELESRLEQTRNLSVKEPNVLRSFLKSWEKDLNRLTEFFQLFDQKERWNQIQAAIASWDRQFLSGPNLREFQQLLAALESLKSAIAAEKSSAATSALMQAENRFERLSLRLQSDAEALKRQREGNARLLTELSEKWQTLSSTTFVPSTPWEAALISDLQNRLEEHWKQLQNQCERQTSENFAQSVTQTRQEMEEFRQTRERLARLATLFGRLESQVSRPQWERFAPEVLQEMDRARDVLMKQLQNRQCARFESDLEALQTLGESQLTKILPEVQARLAHQSRIQTRLNAEQDFLASISENEAARRWANEELEEQTRFLEQLKIKLNSKSADLRSVETETLAWRQRMERILAAINQAQQKELKRQYLVQRFQEKFRELGFSLTAPQLEDSANPASGIILTASRPAEGRTVNVRFDQETREPVLYAVDGFPMPPQTVNGQRFRTCDEAQRQLEILHKLLEKNGILMGKIQWEDQPPVDLAREAMELPDAADRSLTSDEP